MFRVLVILSVLLIAPIAGADLPDGADHPQFQEARDAWLAGDENALPALARLSDGGNMAATLLLARLIEIRENLLLPTRGLPTSISLYDRIKDQVPLAALFQRLRQGAVEPEEVIPMAAAFFDLGEPATAYRIIVNRGTHGFYGRFVDFPQEVLVRGADPSIDLALRAVMLSAMGGQFEGGMAERLFKDYCAEQKRTGAFAPFGAHCAAAGTDRERVVALTLYTASHPPDAETAAMIAAWLIERSPAHRRICDAACPDAINRCAYQIYALNTAAYGQVSLRTPLEMLIPQADYTGSVRAALDLWTRLQFYAERRREYDGGLETDERLTAHCLRDAIDAGSPPWIWRRE